MYLIFHLIFFLLPLDCASLYLYVKVMAVRKIGFIGGILTFLICIVGFFCAKSAKEKITTHEYAIVFTPSVTAKSSPKDNATDALVLHEGTKVLGDCYRYGHGVSRSKHVARKLYRMAADKGNEDARKILEKW